ncbi:hypothetical protein CROQUDRAFT_649656 [Cronartium quercuum f. sp. fusiforme G11]|uniref:Uncharacterized protein n=1 Tax=Cronartium quercuum f. sp. fusiforme G11 TaxID=708437 RepID=A0A9P6THA5_9BASI|nr:hypothetical protein CROQUDRAFT_649656 [Cronartium quercuum f. sp. fusiforme G11]
MASAQQNTTSGFDPTKRLDAYPPLAHRYRLDELLAEHFAFAPKTFTRHLFNLINEAVYDCVESVDEAVRASFPPDLAYPTQDDIAKSINSLETLLCSAADQHFDLMELWLHRNIFAFPASKSEALTEHFKFEHTKIWDYLFSEEKPVSDGTPYVEPDWEKIKVEEERTWDELEAAKQEYLQVTDDHLSLLAVSNALDRKLAGLKAVSAQLDLITSGAPRVYDPETNKPLGLAEQAAKLTTSFSRLSELKKRLENLRSSSRSTNPDLGEDSSNEDTQGAHMPLRYECLLNELAMSKIDDLVAELGEKGGADNQVDEDLMEVMNHLSGKGEATDSDTPLFHKRL